MINSSNPIGLFDSGVGGLTVLKELIKLLPCESLVYFGDTGRIPYGNKSARTIERYSIENSIVLLEHQIKVLIVACNTASALALTKLQQLFKLPILGVIDPSAEKAAAMTRTHKIAVLGTKGTIESGSYQSAIRKIIPDASIISIACPLLVPLVEEQWLDQPATRLIIKEYLKPLKKQKIDTLLLGCTHYPFLKELIQEEVEQDVNIVDSAVACAEKTAQLLKDHYLLNSSLQGSCRYYCSDDPEKFRMLGEKLCHFPISSVELLLPGHF